MISSDFYKVYESAGKKADGLVNLFCWAHVRRHFVRAGDANPAQLKYWTDAWLERIRGLYAAHDGLMAAWQDAAAPAPRGKSRPPRPGWRSAHAAWDTALAVIDEARKKQMAAPGLQEPAKKALATLDREWDGLIAHRDYPMVSLDNNAAERQIRGPVVTRKNAGGSRNGDTARNAAVIWTVTATARMAGLNVLTYLTAYFDECGRNGGKPLAGRALERFLPWNASPEDLRTWAKPPPARQTRANNDSTGTAAAKPPRRPSACPFTGLPNTYVSTALRRLRPLLRFRHLLRRRRTLRRRCPAHRTPRRHSPGGSLLHPCPLFGITLVPNANSSRSEFRPRMYQVHVVADPMGAAVGGLECPGTNSSDLILRSNEMPGDHHCLP